MSKLLAGTPLKLKDGSEVDAGSYLDGKVVGLYFSASWCPPCRGFTPKLKEFYEKIKKTHPEFEVVFVSRDRESDCLVNYFLDHMGDWTYIPFGNDQIQYILSKYEVKTIPAMRVIKPDGQVVVKDARTEIQDKGIEDPEALWEEWMAFYD
ncbi:unnamed protein product [Caenorhabditis auriculariae]|uniref:protein-disulfide reductase n=1 Tax=Caenorhabditis auriculariae TaxID=2777116 RepID=A0A8S1HVS6_9PELO|nr:unnamed protein product [Caenorhabditis auriculariae]